MNSLYHYMKSDMFKVTDFPLTLICGKEKGAVGDHDHDFIELVMVSQGHGMQRVCRLDSSGKRYDCFSTEITAGDIFVIPMGMSHAYYDCDNMFIYNILFQKELISDELSELLQMPNLSTLLGEAEKSKAEAVYKQIRVPLLLINSTMTVLNRIIVELAHRGPAYRIAAKTAFIEFLIMVGKNESPRFPMAGKKRIATGRQRDVYSIITWMETHLDKTASLDDLARKTGMSVPHFSREFRKLTGFSPLNYFLHVRLQEVKSLLISSNLSIEEIAFRVGFCDSSYMIKLFKKNEKITPGDFRDQFSLAIRRKTF